MAVQEKQTARANCQVWKPSQAKCVLITARCSLTCIVSPMCACTQHPGQTASHSPLLPPLANVRTKKRKRAAGKKPIFTAAEKECRVP